MKFSSYIIILFITSQHCFGQFGNPVVIDNTLTINQRNIKVFDVDNDGKQDIILSSFFNDIVWYKNLGTSFASPQSITSTFATPYHLDFYDVNNDGFIDLLATNNSNNNSSVSLFINNNGGASWTEIILDSNIPLGAFKSFFVDIENDGDIDIVTNSDTKIIMYKNDGNTIFTAPIIIENANEYYSMTVADFNGNGFTDLVINTATSGIVIFTNNTTGSFNAPITIDNNELRIFLSSFDVDNDGEVDIVSGNSNSSPGQGVDIFTNNGLGVFNLTNNIPEINNNDASLSQFNHSKLNSDMYIDLLFINSGNLYWKENDQLGVFGASNLIDNTYSYTVCYSGDLNNNGQNDIVWVGSIPSSGAVTLGYMLNETPLNIDSYNYENEIKIFPNPTSNTISVNQEINEIKIYNTIGQIILKTDKNVINVSSLNKGIYFMRVLTKNNTTNVLQFVKI